MAELGADPTDLRELAEDIRHTRRRLERTSRTVTRMVRSAHWTGRDGDRFRTSWAGHSRTLRRVGNSLTEASGELIRNAEEQERVSAVGAGMPVRTRPRRATGPPPHGDPLPLRSESWVLGAEVAAAFGLRAGTTLTVTTLPGGRSMVTVEDSAGGSVSAGIGAEAGLQDGIALELEAHASAEANFVKRRGWLVDGGDVDSFLMRLGLAETVDRAPVLRGNPIMGMAADRIVDAVGLAVGDPDTTDTMFEIRGDLGAAAAALAPLIGVSGAGMGAVGLRQREAGRSLVLEGSTRGDGDAFGAGASGSSHTTVEIPLRKSGTAQPLVVTTSTTGGGEEVLARQVFELEPERTSGAVSEAAQELMTGNPSGAIDALRPVLDSLPGEPVWQDSVTGVITDDVHDLDVGVLLGPKLGGGVEAGRTITDFSGHPRTATSVPAGSGGGSW